MSSILDYYNNKKINGFMGALAENGMIFQSEAQFQHKLAMVIAKDIEKENKKYEILLESWTDTDENKKDTDKKCYTDIVIIDTNSEKKEYIAIELKYKTAEAEYDTDYGTIHLTPQGANDNGCYDYLLDIQRIQNQIDKKSEGNLSECKCVGGYAIILTNEKKYWEYTNENKKKENGYFQFCIGDNSKIIKNKDLNWKSNRKEYNNENDARHTPIKLKYVENDNFKWLPEKENNSEFRYLCLEVKPRKDS